MQERITITDVAKELGVTPRTIMRWEKSGKIRKSRRDWRGWRFYTKDDIDGIRKFYESSYEYDELSRSIVSALKSALAIIGLTALFLTYILCGAVYAESEVAKATPGLVETQQSVNIVLDELPVVGSQPNYAESVKYTLGPDDIISIDVRRHPEFSGKYQVNSEGKIEYKYVGDIIVTGLTKNELKDRLSAMLSDYLKSPEIDVQIEAYLSKVFYVVGEVARPGKFYMKGDTITVREALVQAGLPTYAAAMRRCRIITPNRSDRDNYSEVNVYKLLYEGDLRENSVMKPGNVLYVPATVIAKVIRVISPVTTAVGEATGTAARGAAVAAAAL